MRLIDADAFEVVSLRGKSEEFCNGVMWMLEQIDAQPTIQFSPENDNEDKQIDNDLKNGAEIYAGRKKKNT